MKFKNKEEAIANKGKDDRLFFDPYIKEFFIIRKEKRIWNPDEFEENFLTMPETLEECIKLRGTGQCLDCEYQPRKYGKWASCQKRKELKNRYVMEIENS